MNLPLTIKPVLVSAFLLLTTFAFSQEEKEDKQEADNTTKTSFLEAPNRQLLFNVSLGSHRAFTSGNNFMGKGLQGKTGFQFKTQTYLYKHFFLGVSIGHSSFKVKDTNLVGNYERSRVTESYVFVGYEFFPSPKTRLGLNVVLDGHLNYRNYGIKNSEYIEQNDSAKLNRYGVYFNYEIADRLFLYVDYGLHIAKTNIRTPSELQDFFSKGTYNTIGIGISLGIGRGSIVSD